MSRVKSVLIALLKSGAGTVSGILGFVDLQAWQFLSPPDLPELFLVFSLILITEF